MKRCLSVFLVIIIVLTAMGFPAVMAEDTTTVHNIPATGSTTISTKAYTSHSGSGGTSPMYKGESLTYSLNFEMSGEYRISFKNICFYETTEAEIVMNGWSLIRKTLPYSDKSHTVELGTFQAGAGETKMIFKLYNSACYASSFTIERIGGRELYYIDGSNPDNISASGVTDGKPSVGMSTGSYGEYIFNADIDGIYVINAKVASTENANACVEVFVDEESIGKTPFTGKDWSTFELLPVGTAELTSGQHTLRIKAAGSAMRFSGAKMVSISAETTTAFLDSVRETYSHKALETVLREYSGRLITPYSDYLDDVFYDRMITDKLAGSDCSSLSEFDSKFLSVYNDEITSPLVKLTQNQENVTTLEAGEFTVTVAPRFAERVHAVAALYTEDGETLDTYKEADIAPFEETVITGLEATEGKTLFKIFFLKDDESLTPAELPVIQSSIYVSTDGNDNGNGTVNAPYKTISKAVEKAKENHFLVNRDTNIYLSTGEYFIDSTVTIDDTFALTEDMGIHFMSLNPSEPAVISGGCDVENWTDADSDGIFEAAVPNTVTDVRQLYINDRPAVRARSKDYFVADSRWDDESNNTADGEDTGLTEDGFYVSNPSFPELTKPQDAEISYFILWTVQRLPADDIVYDGEEGRALIKMAQPAYSNALTMICDGGVQPTIGQKFIVENDLTLLDEPGEFYFDKDTRKIYYMPFSEEDMADARTVVGKTEQLFTIAGSSSESKVKNVTFDNIKFRYGGYYTKVNAEGAVSFQAENLANAAAPLGHNPISTGVGRTLEANILVENADGISFDNCDFSCMGATALRYGSGTTNSSVKGSIFTDIGGSALSISTWEAKRPLAENINIEDNVIGRNGIDFMFCPAISIYYAKNVDVIHNTIAHTPYSAISVGWGWAGPGNTTPARLGVGGHNISHNRIYDISKTVVDGGHVYNLGYMTECNVTHNYLTDSPDHGGVYLDTGASNIKINNNVFERCQNYNIAHGGSSSVVGNVAKDNWADKEQSNTWSGSGCSFETVAAITDGNWPDAAKAVTANAGVTEDYKANLSRLDSPAWRTIDPHFYPDTEGQIPGVIFINAADYTDFYIKPSEIGDKPKPSILTFSKTPGVADFRQKEWLEYKVDVPETGDYYLSIYYNKGDRGALGIFLTETPIPDTYDDMDPTLSGKYVSGCPEALFPIYPILATDTKSTAHVPHTFLETTIEMDNNGILHATRTDTKKVLTLNEGTYYLRIFERNGGTNWSRFALTPVK